jgi:adenine-specific DNA-methyltransferase
MDKYVKGTYENILLYARNEEVAHFNYEKDSVDTSNLDKDEISFFKKDYPLHNGTADFHIDNRPNLAYSIYYNPKTLDAITVDEKKLVKGSYKIGVISRKDLLRDGYVRVIPKYNSKYDNQRVWRWCAETFKAKYKTELIFSEDDNYFYQKKRYKEDGSFEKKFKNYINIDGGEGKKELVDIFGKKIFDNPKSTTLLKHLLKIVSKTSSTILDFMAGSGTTGHAVLALNKEDGGNRKFILCTNNENKICENVTWERIKRVSKGYKKQNGDKVEGLGGNLKYLKTDFIKIDNNSDNLKEKTVEASTEILCLKENTFNKVIDDYKKHKIKVFESKNKYTAILFDLFYFDEFIVELKKLKDKKVSIYVFSYTKDFSASEFSDLKIDFTVEAIPEKVLETYKKIFNF